MSDQQPQPDAPDEQQAKQQQDRLAYFVIGISLMITGATLTVSIGWAGLGLVFSGLTFVIISLPAVKVFLANRRTGTVNADGDAPDRSP